MSGVERPETFARDLSVNHVVRWLGYPLVVAALVAACGGPTMSPGLTLSVANGTTITVSLVVNGALVTTVAPGVTEDPVKATLPGLPWKVETRSPSGRTLSMMTVKAGDTTATADSHGQTWTGDVVRVALSCGRLAVWAGPQIEGPAEWSPEPDDCR